MMNPADLKRMLARTRATAESAQKQASNATPENAQDSADTQGKITPRILSAHETFSAESLSAPASSEENPSEESSEPADQQRPKESPSERSSEHTSKIATPHPTAHPQTPRITPAVMRQQIEMAYSSHYSSGYFMDDEEYRAEYDLELTDNGETFAHFSSISSAIVPLYTTSSPDGSGSLDGEDAARLRAFMDAQASDDDLASTSASQASSQNPSAPTPAIMAKKREEGPLTFASLDNHDLPVVREYSAGGLVFDDQDRVAIITRHSRSGHIEWCLPKGHIEKGETSEQTAVREIFEETGIKGEVVDSIATIDYWFTGDAQRIHKLVHHYALRMTGGYLTVEGDPDHEAEDATWVKFDDLTDVLSYPNERRIVWLYAKKRRNKA